jgi:hypothetical protein
MGPARDSRFPDRELPRGRRTDPDAAGPGASPLHWIVLPDRDAKVMRNDRSTGHKHQYEESNMIAVNGRQMVARQAWWTRVGRTVTVAAIVSVGASLTPTAVRAQASSATQGSGDPHYLDASIGLRASTLGLGVEASKLIVGHLGIRAGANFLGLHASHSISNVEYSGRLHLENFPVLLDLYPWSRGSFHLTGGVLFDQNRITGTGVPGPTGNITLNGHSYSGAQIGVLSAAIKYPSTGGYFGLGFGTPARNSLVAFLFDAGAVFSTPKFSLNATNPGADPTLASDTQAQQATSQKKVSKYGKVYPVISTGLALRF